MTAIGFAGAVMFLIVLAAMSATAQPPSTQKPPTQTPTTGTPTTDGADPLSGTGPVLRLPGTLAPPRVGLDLLYAPPSQGRMTITPSLTVSEEFNDNVFLSNTDRRSDFITQFTPGVTLAVQIPALRLTAGYNFTAEIYARDERLNNAANRQNFVTTVSYQPNPVVTLTLADTASYNQNSNAASVSGIASGRQEVWSNVFQPGVDFRLTPRLTWHVLGAYTLERYASPGSRDTDVYRIGTTVDFSLNPRLIMTGGYDFTYLDIDGEPTSVVHTPRIGGTYRATPTVTAMVSAGPSFLVSDGETSVTPAVTARVAKTATWGVLSVFYDRTIGTAGGFGGVSDNQTFGGNVVLSKLRRGLVLDFSPRYIIAESERTSQASADIKALTLNLTASYEVARNIAVVGAYTFFIQQTGRATGAMDVDQNRLFIGLRFGYPITISDIKPAH